MKVEFYKLWKKFYLNIVCKIDNKVINVENNWGDICNELEGFVRG